LAWFPCLFNRTFSAKKQYFSLTTNQQMILFNWSFQQSERGVINHAYSVTASQGWPDRRRTNIQNVHARTAKSLSIARSITTPELTNEKTILPPYRNECSYGLRAGKSISRLTKFLVNIIHIYNSKIIYYKNTFYN
jgi:hypothetical protein